MKNKIAAEVVENIYSDIANGHQRVCMLQEFLDHQFRTFKVRQWKQCIRGFIDWGKI